MFLLIYSSSLPCAVAQPRPATRKPAHHHGPCPLDPGPRRDRGTQPLRSAAPSLPPPRKDLLATHSPLFLEGRGLFGLVSSVPTLVLCCRLAAPPPHWHGRHATGTGPRLRPPRRPAWGPWASGDARTGHLCCHPLPPRSRRCRLEAAALPCARLTAHASQRATPRPAGWPGVWPCAASGPARGP